MPALLLSDEPKNTELTGFLRQVFGSNQRLSKQDFIKSVTNSRCNWVFDASQVRLRVAPFLDPKVLGSLPMRELDGLHTTPGAAAESPRGEEEAARSGTPPVATSPTARTDDTQQPPQNQAVGGIIDSGAIERGLP